MITTTKQNILFFFVGILFMFVLNGKVVVNGYSSFNEQGQQQPTTTTLIRRSLTKEQETQAQQKIPITKNLRHKSLRQPEKRESGGGDNCPKFEERNRCNDEVNTVDAYWCCYLCFGLSSCDIPPTPLEDDGSNVVPVGNINNNNTEGEEM